LRITRKNKNQAIFLLMKKIKQL